ncbi:MAG: hypothetical protein B7Y41_15955 [Hydrogenophilales bacterium 28-61-23]|nr:MAG: hypothetical protein B7Y41_15955 [Hydrogenophilales bacterium 28-61-23]
MSLRHILLIASLFLQAGNVHAVEAQTLAQIESTAAKEASREDNARFYLSGENLRSTALQAADNDLRIFVEGILRPDATEGSTAIAKQLNIAALKNAVTGYEDALNSLLVTPGLDDAKRKLKAATDTARQRITALDKETASFARLSEKDAQKRLPQRLSAVMETRGALFKLRMAAEVCRSQTENLALDSGRAADAARRQLLLIKPPAAAKPALPPPTR